jgi:HrpA-like RNA helicase
MPGQEEIDAVVTMVKDRALELPSSLGALCCMPMYASLPKNMQMAVFEVAPRHTRKVIVATTIAETSLTIDGIVFVIDPGFVKIPHYNATTGLESLVVAPVSQASAKQRAGRAGRVRPGKCYRLYTEAAFLEKLRPDTIPEMQRSSLTVSAVRWMGSLNVFVECVR